MKATGAADLLPAAGTARTICVAIAICTYRRAQLLARTLDGISRLTFPAGRAPCLHVVVVDNDGDPAVKAVVDAFADRSGIAATYAVESQRGISQARNRALDLVPADADFVAFIDDDETPSPGWLQALLQTQSRTEAAVVCGPVSPDFAADPPAWIADGAFFEQPRRTSAFGQAPADGSIVDDASTNNALVRLDQIRRTGARFHESFGLSGGEDALFFRQLAGAGATMVWSPGAEVSELVPAARARFGYLVREYFRCGNVRAAIEALDNREFGTQPTASMRHAAVTLKKSLKKALIHSGALLAAVFGLRGRARAYAHVFELANAAGRLCYLFGFRYQHYR